jgi:hypothetical protein
MKIKLFAQKKEKNPKNITLGFTKDNNSNARWDCAKRK